MVKLRATDGAASGSSDEVELDETSAVEKAKEWYDHDRRSPSHGNYTMNTPVLGAYRNSSTEWSLLYSIEPKPGHHDPGITFLWRYTFARAGSTWKVTGAVEENACMHADNEERDIPELDETRAAEAAKRWYDQHFSGGMYSMTLPHVSAYCNRARGFPRLWTICYRATGAGIDPEEEHFVQFKYAAQKKGDGWEWRAVSLDGGSREVDAAAPTPAPAAAENATKKTKKPRLTIGSKEGDETEGAAKTKRPRLTVGPGSKEVDSAEIAAKQTKRPRLTFGSSSDHTGGDKTKRRGALSIGPSSSASAAAEKGRKPATTKVVVTKHPNSCDGDAAAVALDKQSAVKAAKDWFEKEHHDQEMVPLKIYKNNDRECSLLYRTEPNINGNTFLLRFKFSPPSDTNDRQWTVKSRPYEDDAAMYEDEVGPPEDNELDELDEQTAVKAAKRWYNEYFYGGGYEMDIPVLGAYRNSEQNIEPNEPCEWSLLYTANGDSTQQHFVRFKYRPERGLKGWTWRVYGYSETEEPSEHIGNSLEGYQHEQLNYAPKRRDASSRKREADGGTRSGARGIGGLKSTKQAKPKKPKLGAAANTAERAGNTTSAAATGAAALDSDNHALHSADMKARILEPKRELMRLPYVMPSADCEDEAYRDIGGPKVRAPRSLYYAGY